MSLNRSAPSYRFLTVIKSVFRGKNAAGFMFLFAVSLLTPAFVFGCAIGWFYIRAEEARVIENARDSVRSASISIGREVDSRLMVLRVLATSPLLLRGNLENFQERARNVSRVLGTPIMLRVANGPKVIVIRPGTTGDVTKWQLSAWQSSELAAVESGRASVSSLFLEPGTDENVVAISVPVTVNGHIGYVLSTMFTANDILKIISRMNFKPGWVGSVMDAQGRIVARTLEQDSYVGRLATREWISQTGLPSGVWHGLNLKGIPVVSAYSRSGDTGWTTAVTVPLAVLNSPVRNVLNLLVAGGVLLLTVSLCVAIMSASYLSRALKALVRVGIDPERYGTDGLPATRIREIDAAARILQGSAHAAARREAQLRSILETIPNAMVTIDAAGTIRSYSRTAEVMFGYTAEEVIGRNVNMLMPEPERSAHDAALKRYVETGIPKIIGSRQIVRGKRKDG